MKALLDFLLVGIFTFFIIYGGQYTLKEAAAYVQRLALEKAATGLGDLEPATSKMTGEKLDF